ncbi:MAG: YkgJ family cysteine cluster protein [Syntrophobacteraceae bacterium]
MEPNGPAQDRPTLHAGDTFRFSCHDNLPCFTQCCRDVNIYLTPYDMLRLRRALGIKSGEILAKYTRLALAGPAKLPFVQLLMDPKTLRCQFVTGGGCSVYDNRPWACRMYPLDLGSTEGEYRIFVGTDRCLGLREAVETVAGDWLAGQGVEPHLEMDRKFEEVIPAGFRPDDRLGDGVGHLLYLAYDLDRFAELLKDEQFRTAYEIDDEMLRRLKEDDELLLRLAFRYIRDQFEDLMDMA